MRFYTLFCYPRPSFSIRVIRVQRLLVMLFGLIENRFFSVDSKMVL
ncbi:hypothetical protein GEOBRER4_n3094 [Citrifermentans bremense]|uniref:Uncharacterized protein n=1 Tax=Citrifermentans bremense TaxID=60035 RepID=A0A7R7FT35_9BACT|nr:hypothetical protein GEOBRER4_n3094 [Citrifermentans bremense]